MDKYGKLLFLSKYEELKNALVYMIVGIGFLFGSNYVYGKVLYCLFGIVFILVGLYIFFFKRKNGVAIYEEAIVFLGKEERVIHKNEIQSIEYKKLKAMRSPVVSYYPTLILKNNTAIRLNVFFNGLVNRNLKTIMQEYLS